MRSRSIPQNVVLNKDQTSALPFTSGHNSQFNFMNRSSVNGVSNVIPEESIGMISRQVQDFTLDLPEESEYFSID